MSHYFYINLIFLNFFASCSLDFIDPFCDELCITLLTKQDNSSSTLEKSKNNSEINNKLCFENKSEHIFFEDLQSSVKNKDRNPKSVGSCTTLDDIIGMTRRQLQNNNLNDGENVNTDQNKTKNCETSDKHSKKLYVSEPYSSKNPQIFFTNKCLNSRNNAFTSSTERDNLFNKEADLSCSESSNSFYWYNQSKNYQTQEFIVPNSDISFNFSDAYKTKDLLESDSSFVKKNSKGCIGKRKAKGTQSDQISKKPKLREILPLQTPKIINNFNSSLNKNYEQENSFLIFFSGYVFEIERELQEFLDRFKNCETDIQKVLYSEELAILNTFSFNTFGKLKFEHPEILKKVSSTADMLNLFVNDISPQKNPKIFKSLAKCFNFDSYCFNNEEKITISLKNKIKNFLTSDESKYVKSISTELNSFYKSFKSDQFYNDTMFLKAFAAFIILIKRNNINTPKLKGTLLLQKYKENKFEKIQRESTANYAFLFAFINNLPYKNESNIKSNLCTSVIYNCLLDQIRGSKMFILCFRILSILKYFFFDLKSYNIFPNFNEIFSMDENNTLKVTILPEISKNAKDVKVFILSKKWDFLDLISPNLIAMKKKKKHDKVIQSYLLHSRELSIAKLDILSCFAYTCSAYLDSKMGIFMIINYRILKKSKNKSDLLDNFLYLKDDC